MGYLFGTWVSRTRRWFVVEIQYREPTYEARHGRRANPYRFRYRLEAASAADARELAILEFARVSAMSSVGWTREIVGVEIASVQSVDRAR
jgi:hypothetical protein